MTRLELTCIAERTDGSMPRFEKVEPGDEQVLDEREQRELHAVRPRSTQALGRSPAASDPALDGKPVPHGPTSKGSGLALSAQGIASKGIYGSAGSDLRQVEGGACCAAAHGTAATTAKRGFASGSERRSSACWKRGDAGPDP